MICFWEDDPVQYNHPDINGDANIPSLKQVQKNYILFGACEEICNKYVRNPCENDIKDSDWKPL